MLLAEWQSSQPTRLLDTLVLAGVASTFGPDDSAAAAQRLQPLADVLAANLAEYGISDAEVRIAPDYETLITWLKDGEVDLTFDDTYQAMRIYTESGARPVLRSWQGGIRDYSAVVFAAKATGLFSLDDITGRIMAVDAPTSPAGFMLPMFFLTEVGFNMVEKTDPLASVSSNEVGYVFSGDDQTTIAWVLDEQVGIGIVTDTVYDALPPETQNELTLISKTPPIARQVVIVRADFDPDLLDALIALMPRLSDMDEAQQALDAFDVTQFDAFDTDSATMLSTTLAMFETVQNR
jgi:phosphonate transport system substrate-binding protein